MEIEAHEDGYLAKVTDRHASRDEPGGTTSA
jgi:hypothetical protein